MIEFAEKEPGLQSALGPPSVCLNPQVEAPEIVVSASRLATARGVADSKLNSKSLANLLCTHRPLTTHGSGPCVNEVR